MGKGKQRNSRRLRPQEYDDIIDVLGRGPDADEPEAPPEPRPTPRFTSTKPNSRFPEGTNCTVPDKSKIGDGERRPGVVWFSLGEEAFVLDASGLIHRVHTSEIGLDEAPSA